MPSTISSSKSKLWLFSSTEMAPSWPTFSMASAIFSPISASPAEMVPTLAICCWVSTGVASALMASTTASVAFWMPRRMPRASAPAVTLRRPSPTITSASRVAVVVPSPATSLVLTATSRTSWAPMFSTGFSSSTSLATVTPSLVISGAP